MMMSTFASLYSALLLSVAARAFQPMRQSPGRVHHTGTRTRPRTYASPIILDAAADADAYATDTRNAVEILLGGDYAGHYATFSSIDGSIIPVPEHLVPESLIEWGQIPTSLEVLSSEDLAVSNVENIFQLNRTIVQILPEVGCGVDNMNTMRKTQALCLSASKELDSNTDNESVGVSRMHTFFQDDDDDDEIDENCVITWTTDSPPRQGLDCTQIETIFTLPAEEASSIPLDILGDEGKEQQLSVYPRRVRVTFETIPEKCEVCSPITVVVERQTSAKSTGGQWGVGGGLDGRSVSRLIGKENAAKPFVETKPLLLGDGEEEENGKDEELTLSLPGNLVVRHGKTESGLWFVDLILVATTINDDEEGDGNEGKKMMISGSTVCRRLFEGKESQVSCYFD